MTQATLVRPTASSQQGSDEPFASPLFREVVARWDCATRRVILEPGATNASLLAQMEGKRCCLLVADAAQALSALSGESLDAAALEERVRELIPSANREKVDTVLSWDLLNYLDPPLLAAFAARLLAIMSPTGVIHAYIHSAHATMPQRPQRYSALKSDLVALLDHDIADTKTPRYSAWDLEKHGIGLRVERSMLLRNGMQEYLLSIDPSRSGPRDVKPLYHKPRTRKRVS